MEILHVEQKIISKVKVTNILISDSTERMSSLICLGGKLDKNNLIQFMKDLKQSHPDMTDEEAAKIAASKIADSKPKSRMYYKIGASRNIGGGKKVDPKSQINDKLKVILPY